jgi:glucose-6-phosphate 1-dehydrogenase
MVSTVIPVKPFDLVIFGATGDLSHRKILPSLYRRLTAKQIPEGARIIGAARSKMSRAEFRKSVRESLEEFVGAKRLDGDLVAEFLERIDYVAIDAMGENGWATLARKLDEKPDNIRAFYLSVAPSLFAEIADRLAAAGTITTESRIVVEKPLGHDLASARALNDHLSRHFDETQIYRIDHYLGKETVQNLMAIRFANALFEPLWNARFVDHVQITVAESIGVEGRGAYYDKSGAMRDMVQNHIMQLLCLTAMEPPVRTRATSSTSAIRRAQPRASSQSAPISPTGAGRARRSTCAPARS